MLIVRHDTRKMGEPQPNSAPRRHPLLTVLAWFGVSFVCYFLLLGPVHALENHRVLIIPNAVDKVFWAPADILLEIPVVRQVLHSYLGLWYVYPNGPC